MYTFQIVPPANTITRMYHTTPLDQPIPLEEARLERWVPLDPRFPGCFAIDPALLAEDDMRLANALLTGETVIRI